MTSKKMMMMIKMNSSFKEKRNKFLKIQKRGNFQMRKEENPITRTIFQMLIYNKKQ
jgi:hypothetical protein